MKKVQVIESVEAGSEEWIISLTDNNPTLEESFVVKDAKEAFRIQGMIEKWANDNSKYYQLERQVLELLSVTGCKNVLEVVDYFKNIPKK
jgi:hypothetical protein